MTESIVCQVCAELKIHPTEFFGPKRNRTLTRARRIAINRLIAAGFSMAGAARMIKRNYSTVRYWMNTKIRERHNERARNHWRSKNAGWVPQGSFIREEEIPAACLPDAGIHGGEAHCDQVRHQAAHDFGVRSQGGSQGQAGQGAGGLEKDPIIDRSPEQKRLRMVKVRAELAQMGYSIVETEWLKATLLSNLSRERGRPRKPFRQVEYSEQAAG